MAPEHMDVEAKQFTPPKGMANVYLVRSSMIGSAIAFQSTINGKRMGGVAPGCYLMNSVKPGSHVLEVFSNENADMAHLNAQAGLNYFYEAKPKMGWQSARVELSLIEAKIAKTSILSCRRSMSFSY